MLVLIFGGLLGAALPASPLWYLIPPLFIVFLAVMAAGRRVGDRGFLVLATGELLVAAAGTGLPWIVLPLQCLLVGVVLAELRLFTCPGDILRFGVFTLGAGACLALLLLTRNVLLSGCITVGLFFCIYVGLTVTEHEHRRVLAGSHP
jgi:hypothetical protein